MLDWDDLHSFLAIARAGTLSGAARSLGVRQSTMGRRLAALEARAGARLLVRTPRGFLLTPAGEAARAEVERMEQAAFAAERAVSGKDVRLEGSVRLTTVEGFAETILMPVFGALAVRYPGIVIELISSDRTLSLAAREADLAIRLARPQGQSIVARRIGTVAFGLYASADYLARRGMPDFGADGGQGHRLIQMRDDTGAYPEMDRLAMLAPRAVTALRADNRRAHVTAAMAGLGIAVLAHHAAADTVLVRVPADALPGREIWLAQHRDTSETPRIRAVAEAIASGLRAAEGLFAGRDQAPANP